MKQDKEEYDMLSLVAIERVKELAKGQETYQIQVGELGKFSVIKYRTWKYGPIVEDLERKLKTRRKTEEADGTATAEEKDILKFNVKKEKKDV